MKFLQYENNPCIIQFSITSPSLVYAEEMFHYENDKYGFSLSIPQSWDYQEDVFLDLENIEEVFFFPEEFSMKNAVNERSVMDVVSMMGWEFQFESPLIGIDHRTISTSDVSVLTEESLSEYFIDETMDLDPSVEILESYSTTHPNGWEVGIISTFNLDIGDGSTMSYKYDEKLFVLKDRQVYGVDGSFEKNYDKYEFAYECVLETASIIPLMTEQNADEIESNIQDMYDDVVSDVNSIQTTEKNIDEMSDGELIQRLEKMMTESPSFMDEAMEKFKIGELDESYSENVLQQLTDWQKKITRNV